jgi:tetratricopeptide (TPR) repeat protein
MFRAVTVPGISILIFLLFLSLSCNSAADTVIMKSRERVKGVVVEEYSDRVRISTMEGEREILKNGIERIVYDLEEQNLTNLADFYMDRGMYKMAYHYYEQALNVNPE